MVAFADRRGTYGEAFGRCPDGASSGIADDGFVDVTGAYKAAQ